MQELSSDFPAPLRHLPIDPRWMVPVPAFADRAGRVDMGAVDFPHLATVIRARGCPTCGGQLGADEPWTVLGGPGSWREGWFALEAVGHRECIEYGLHACPWLRNETWTFSTPLAPGSGDPRRSPVWILGEAPEVRTHPKYMLVVAIGRVVRTFLSYQNNVLTIVTADEANRRLADSGDQGTPVAYFD